jgi:ketosteroid isomerase-like protein
MSEENLETIQRIFDEVSVRHDVPRDLYDPDFEADLTEFAGGGLLRGLDAMLELMRPYWEAFEDFRYEIEEVIHTDETQVIAAVRDGGRMKGSDAEVWTRFFDVVTFRNGKVLRISAHLDKEQALEAAGLDA